MNSDYFVILIFAVWLWKLANWLNNLLWFWRYNYWKHSAPALYTFKCWTGNFCSIWIVFNLLECSVPLLLLFVLIFWLIFGNYEAFNDLLLELIWQSWTIWCNNCVVTDWIRNEMSPFFWCHWVLIITKLDKILIFCWEIRCSGCTSWCLGDIIYSNYEFIFSSQKKNKLWIYL